MKISDITPKGWIAIGITVLLIILIVYYFKNKNTVTTKDTVVTNPANAVVNATSPTKDDKFPLSYGARGNNVKAWQTYLNKLGAKLTVDGVWGLLTEAASIQYTKFNNITQEYFTAVVK